MAHDPRRGEAKARGGASVLDLRWRDRLDAVLDHHRASARDAARRLLANRVTTLMTVLVIAVALSLPAVLYVVLDNLRALSGHYEGQAQISLFLKQDVTAAAQRKLADRLAARADIKEVEVITREQALEEFRAQSGLAEVLETLEGNPLPGVIVVQPASVTGAPALRDELAGEPMIDIAQLDSAWLQKLRAVLVIGERLGQALGAAFALVVALVVVNSIRLGIESRREEILVVKLVGGTDAFVRRPFLYTGLWLGLAGSLMALLMVGLLVWWLAGPVATLAGLYGADYMFTGLGAAGMGGLLAAGTLLGWAGAWWAAARHLAEIEPR